MNQRSLDILEYPRIREEIAGFCMSEEGRHALMSAEPLCDSQEIERRKTLGRAWMRALSAETPPRLTGWPAISSFITALKVEGASLHTEECYALGLFCSSSNGLREWASMREKNSGSGRIDVLSQTGGTDPLVQGGDALLVISLLALPDLSLAEQAIFRIIDRNTGEIRDLPELRAIRQEIRKIRQDIDRLVGSYLSDDSLKTALQSNLPTVRDGRQVIAVRANYKGRIKGIVHEVSQSGQTVYLEPTDVVDRNNDLVSEESRLAREIARIIRELTAELSMYYQEIRDALQSLCFFDGIGAAARWGRDYRCVYADCRGDGVSAVSMLLKQARHPLLKTHAVPIDLALSPGNRMLIITGPNTGGKTVTLKTAALLSLINQTGWPIPAAEGSALPVFDAVYCDIGDEQSLSQSLSTFSAHMKNIASILEHATDNSLILLDELGSGTDPQEGSAIAMAVLDRLLAVSSLVLITTHHGILKNYGYTHAQCVNASVDFDENTLSPTYRILMGVPGESHALDIALRNGLDGEVVDHARQYLIEERADVSALIKGLTAKHEELEGFEQVKKKEEAALREKRRKTDLKELQLRQKELELREAGYRRLETLFDESRKQLENLVREIREGELTREKTQQVKAWMASFEELVEGEKDGLRLCREETQSARRALEQTQAQEAASRSQDAPFSRSRRGTKKVTGVSSPESAKLPDLAPGIEVYIGENRRLGVLVREEKGGKWIVATGQLRMTVRSEEIQAVPLRPGMEKNRIEVHTEMGSDDSPVFELKLLGMRHDEALKALERQLDLACMKGLKEFSVVHGKGHGVLQSAVHQVLAHTSAVSDYHFARPEDGGSGKTVVTLG